MYNFQLKSCKIVIFMSVLKTFVFNIEVKQKRYIIIILNLNEKSEYVFDTQVLSFILYVNM